MTGRRQRPGLLKTSGPGRCGRGIMNAASLAHGARHTGAARLHTSRSAGAWLTVARLTRYRDPLAQPGSRCLLAGALSQQGPVKRRAQSRLGGLKFPREDVFRSRNRNWRHGRVTQHGVRMGGEGRPVAPVPVEAVQCHWLFRTYNVHQNKP